MKYRAAFDLDCAEAGLAGGPQVIDLTRPSFVLGGSTQQLYLDLSGKFTQFSYNCSGRRVGWGEWSGRNNFALGGRMF
jgi:hypothetical protein